MRTFLKSIIMAFLLLLAFFLPIAAWSSLTSDPNENGCATAHAFQVIDHYCQRHRMKLNPDHLGPLIIPLNDSDITSAR